MISVLDYGIGNLRSAQKALQHVGADARLARRPEDATGASGIVLPGVGAFGSCVAALHGSGLAAVAVDAANGTRPLLAICVGFQMLFEGSDEDPEVSGLGVLKGRSRRLPPGEKCPQMQWNKLQTAPHAPPSAMMAPFDQPPWVYFVHSFVPYPEPPADSYVVATCDYGGMLTAAVERGTLWGCQFHPEKSGAAGLEILAAFARLCE